MIYLYVGYIRVGKLEEWKLVSTDWSNVIRLKENILILIYFYEARNKIRFGARMNTRNTGDLISLPVIIT